MKEGRCPGCDVKLKFDKDDLSGTHPVRCPDCMHEFDINEVKFPSTSWGNNTYVGIAIIFGIFLLPVLFVFGLGSDQDDDEVSPPVQESVQGIETKILDTNLKVENPTQDESSSREYEVVGVVNRDASKVLIEGEEVDLKIVGSNKSFTHKLTGLEKGENIIKVVSYDSNDKRSDVVSLTVVVSVPTYKVVEVIDGDTIKISKDGKTESVRLIGIDSPESGECFFQEAKEGLSDILKGEDVEIEMDTSQGDRDKYDRLLAYVWVDDLIVNERMVRRGYAKEYTYDGPYKYQEEFKAADLNASTNKVGLFGSGCKCEKGEERKCSSCKTATIITTNYDCSTSEQSVTDYSCTSGCAVAPVPTPAPSPAPSRFTCDCSKTCSKTISSCEEAYYLMNTCGCNNKDGDGDGVPCENLCPGG